ncbi:sensor histidine kinase [Amnibacterium flavum]|uniref:histidine kinase n=1 Tax=Amnibacterium flavum TaxID=2173173 RepID=A0A2V1HV87_9MICO|nr:ATP-binding protein [Amnibacterium flavum]PVZ95642.1 two-component sensor histidine kinase [Amnibacterium flavum]
MRGTRTLRSRLVLIVVALTAVVSVIVGVASVTLLNGYLVEQLDASLTQSAGRAQGALGPLGPPLQESHDEMPDGSGDGFLDAPGQASGTISGIIVNNVLLLAGYPDAEGVSQFLDNQELRSLAQVPLDGSPHTVDLGEDLGEYRVVSHTTSAGYVILTGLPLASVNAVVGQLALVIALVALVGLGLAALGARAIVGVALRPLNRVAATAASVARLPLDRGDVDISIRVPERDTDPTTEVGQVGTALNSLLGHVGSALAARQRSEDKVRHFVADASHELRTPLASIRGYSELTTRTQPDLPPEVSRNLGRIESEAMRMTSLVEDLLLLARLDSQPELRQDEVDMSILVLETVGDAHAAGPDHNWVIDLPEEPVVVIGDDPRLRQIVVNLLANARTHTPPGTTVTTSLERSGDDVRLRVADDGPGIDPELVGTLFERFVRGDESRNRSTGSTGLGLSIVKAVVEAHGGTVEVESEPGDTVFTVTLPAATGATYDAAPEIEADEELDLDIDSEDSRFDELSEQNDAPPAR